MGGILSAANSSFNLPVFILALLTTLSLQILANLANDFGDSFHGVDNESRVGPARTVQSGAISKDAMVNGIKVTIIISSVFGVSLLLVSTWGSWYLMGGFALLGLAAIGAAIKYTVGSKPYGYYGFGDLFVFIFFGLAGVYGSYFLMTLNTNTLILLPASSLGLLSIGVLNLNNMRDFEQDRISGKNTLVVKLGFNRAKFYHLFLITGAIALGEVYSTFLNVSFFQRFYLVPSILFLIHLKTVFYVDKPVKMDSHLKKLSLMILLYAISFSLTIYWVI